MHFPMTGVLWFAICPRNSCISPKSFLQVMLWFFICSTHFQSSLDEVVVSTGFALCLGCVPGRCCSQLLPSAFSAGSAGGWEGHLSIARIALCWEHRLEVEQMEGRKESRCKEVVELPCFICACPLYLFILECLCRQNLLCQESGCGGGARPLLPRPLPCWGTPL